MRAEHKFETRFRDQILQCSRCGFCQAVCPVFGATLRPSMSARGKMLLLKEVMEGRIDLGDELIDSLFQCTHCAGCVDNCPSGVRVPEIIQQVRKDMVRIGSCHPAFKGMHDILQRYPNIYGDTEQKDLGRGRNRKADVVYFVGCVGLYREEEATRSVLKLLDRLKVGYTLIDEVCCSGVLEEVGYGINRDLARRNIDLFQATGAKTVITGCPFCFRTFTEKPEYEALRKRGTRIVHLSHFLQEVDFGVMTEKCVTYHDPCDLGRHLKSFEAPRNLIRKMAPRFVEMAHHGNEALCCGAGGGVRAAYPKHSIAIARRRLKEAEEAGAEVVLTDCNSCVHNLSNARTRRQKIRVYSTASFINDLMEEKEKAPKPL
jgi:Fe-S oxidoreductase